MTNIKTVQLAREAIMTDDGIDNRALIAILLATLVGTTMMGSLLVDYQKDKVT